MFTQPIALVAVIGIVGSVLLLTGACINDTVFGNNNNDITMTDIDSNVYRAVKIGSQIWTTENLRTTKYNDGSPILNLTIQTAWDSCFYTLVGAFCYYNNTTNPDSIKKSGALYNWYAVNTGKLAPAGWHVPTDEEWDTLQNYLIANGYNWDGTTEGNKIAKSMAIKEDWESSGIEGAVGNDLTKNDRSGFSALPAGARDPDGFNGYNNSGSWWSATNGGAFGTCNCTLSFDYEDFLRLFTGKNRGFSVRLVRDSN